jgi:hypothetical protein
VLLLVVLALLAIFALVGVAFVVMTSQAQRSALPVERIEQGVDTSQLAPARTLLQQAAMQVLHGPSGTATAMGAHSLMEEMYGNGWVSGTISTAASDGLPQLIDVTPANTLVLNTSAGTTTLGTLVSVAAEIARRGGCVLTITNQYRNNNPSQSNPCFGQSTRIVGINPSATNFQVMAFPDGSLPQQNDTFVINGPAFSGTGFGFDVTGNPQTVTAGTTTGPLALFPNYSDPTKPNNRNPAGGANSDYTAPDFQHMLLAAQVATGPAGAPTVRTLPSMQRPALCRYWAGQVTPNPDFTTVSGIAVAARAMSADLKRAIIMRPLPEDHPDFTGSNPTAGTSTTDYTSGFNPCWDGTSFSGTFSYDVDNDGDGVPDSIWIDLGFPVQTTSDGRLYKPLFALLCVDLDGRVNLNAHGSLAQLSASSVALTSPTGATAPDNGVRGQGFGPAEVNLLSFLGSTATYSQLLSGGTLNGNSYEGRYGSRKLPGTTDLDGAYANRWFDYAGQTNGASNNYWWGFWSNPTNYVLDSYGSPPDPFGVGGVTLDTAGRPVYKCTATGGYGFGSGIADSPYQMYLGPGALRGLSSTQNTQNNSFSPSELERLLRPYDRDAPSLPPRLAALTGLAGAAPQQILKGRFDVTTESWDWPGQTISSPSTAASTVANAARMRVTELLMARAMAAMSSAGSKSQTMVLKALPQVLSPELFVGLKMNINRPFGNGRDYDRNYGDDQNSKGVVDAPINPKAPKQVALASSNGTTSVLVSYAGTGTTGTSATSLQARQDEARYLYVMVLTLANRTKLVQAFNNDPEQAARAVAQWAVNVVDFRDRDNIMTPFDYDPNYAYPDTDTTHPIFNLVTGVIWSPPGDPLHRVWGCNRPELLISETLAFHDRRTDDTADEYPNTIDKDGNDKDQQKSPGTTTETDPDKKDGSFDQTYRPQPSLFVELYNPSSRFEPQSGDLYFYSAAKKQWVLSLAQLSGTVTTSTVANKPSPVWRLLIASSFRGTSGAGGGGTSTALDPDDPNTTGLIIEREVYFVPLAYGSSTMTVPSITDTAAKVQFFPSASTMPSNVDIPSGGYAVIGPGENPADHPAGYQPDANGKSHLNRTYLGFLVGGTAGNSQTRYIDLDLASSTGTLPVQNNKDPASLAALVYTPVTLAINSPKRLSISEPFILSGSTTVSVYDQYEATVAGMIQQDNNGRYTTVQGGRPSAFDLPFDQPRFAGALKDDTNTAALKTHLKTNHTESAFRMIYLQRLANPLKPYNNVWGDPDYNPYRTIDCMAADLTVFNGVSDKTDPYAGGNAPGNFHFESRQRGENNDNNYAAGGLNTNMDLWRQEPVDKSYSAPTPTSSVPGHYFTAGLKHSLGYLNQPFGSPGISLTGEKGLLAGTTTAQYGTFPWLTWNNRPYVSPLELTLVPWLSSSQLLGRYAVGTGTASPYTAYNVPFPQLLNFFPSGAPGSPDEELHRVLEYLTVPSPFVGTDVWANPTSAENGTHAYHPPFNQISNYREPGRINLNTIYDQNVFNALMAGGTSSTSGSSWTQWPTFVQSRSGGTGTGVLDMPPVSSPTEFAHPFRSFAGATMIPTLAGNNPLKPQREIDVTLLRESPAGGQPLFQFSSAAPTASDNTVRNPYFHYQGLQRLGNLVTTRSNVFAVWITVGYFEVKPWPNGVDTAHPDGYQLEAELGIDTGEVVRHRAFYIIDRTLPVGFQRGQDLNSDKAILINRFIE